MSLATRCTACGTVFRVVQDQLKVSEGWVRCGRCSAVFNALEGLLDLDRDAPVGSSAGASDGPAAPSMSAPSMSAASVVRPDAPGEALPAAGTDVVFEAVVAPAMSPHDTGQRSTPAGRVSERDRLEFPDAQFDSDMLAEDPVRPTPPSIDLESVLTARIDESSDIAPAPEFVRHARRRARWQSPAMRGVQACAALALSAALGLQALHHQRNLVAARWPQSVPLLTSWCTLMACRIDAPSRIDDVAVESTALTRADVPDAFKLSVVLRNRGVVPVALPSVDLALTDTTGQLIARLMLAPHDFGAAPTSIRPGGESALQLVLTTGSARVTGYVVELFYP